MADLQTQMKQAVAALATPTSGTVGAEQKKRQKKRRVGIASTTPLSGAARARAQAQRGQPSRGRRVGGAQAPSAGTGPPMQVWWNVRRALDYLRSPTSIGGCGISRDIQERDTLEARGMRRLELGGVVFCIGADGRVTWLGEEGVVHREQFRAFNDKQKCVLYAAPGAALGAGYTACPAAVLPRSR